VEWREFLLLRPHLIFLEINQRFSLSMILFRVFLSSSMFNR
jgi:hypothetical protein